jgi:hypothetical protein
MIRAFLEFHGVFGISPAAKMGSVGDNVDEPGRSALVRRDGDEWVGRWCGAVESEAPKSRNLAKK